jgi:hypothetical protein
MHARKPLVLKLAHSAPKVSDPIFSARNDRILRTFSQFFEVWISVSITVFSLFVYLALQALGAANTISLECAYSGHDYNVDMVEVE